MSALNKLVSDMECINSWMNNNRLILNTCRIVAMGIHVTMNNSSAPVLTLMSSIYNGDKLKFMSKVHKLGVIFNESSPLGMRCPLSPSPPLST